MSPTRFSFQRLARPLKILVQLGVLVVILGAVSTIGFIEYSAQPGFCDNCHIMQPYYDSWASSSHRDVACIKCHYSPGIKAEAMGKLQAANQVVKYVTGTYGMKPWAEIEDAACLRSGCHEQRKLEGEVVYRGVRFDHTDHLGELRRGKQLRCTSCHSQIVQGQHVTVTASTCVLCHFKGVPAGMPVAGCVGCHPSPPRFTSPAGFVVDHPQYVADLVSCVSCHQQVTAGSGEAEQSRCFNCHNEPERVDQFENTTLVHRVHIAEHNVECAQCHVAMEHRVVSPPQTFALDCQACHQGTHEAQQRMYAGMGGHGTESMPSTMFLANVSCSGCHELLSDVPGHGKVQLAGEASCLSCHGIRYANILPAWQQEIEAKLARVGPVVIAARRSLGSTPARTRGTADSLLRLAHENVEFVRIGRGAHNIVFADRLLRTALDLVRQAVTSSQLPYRVPDIDLGPEVTSNVCLQCHFGAERRRVRFQGAEFNHEVHVVTENLTCAQCHTPLEDHGGTTLTDRSSCNACHHASTEPTNCARCHAGAVGAPDTSLALPAGAFSHQVHRNADINCATCHISPSMDASEIRCETCHDTHHQPEVECLACHQGGVLAKHSGTPVHVPCTQCHGAAVGGLVRWSRQICTACHADRTEHNAPLDCWNCHNVPPISTSGDELEVGIAHFGRAMFDVTFTQSPVPIELTGET